MAASTGRAVVSTWPVPFPNASFRRSFALKKEISLPHFGACLGGTAVPLDANSADAIAVGDPVRRRGDDTIVKRNARRQFDIAPQIASDGYGLEQHLVVRTDGRNAQAVLVEDQGTGGNVQRHGVALWAHAHIGIA